MLPEAAIRHAEAALWLAAREYFTSRMVALLNQSREYHRHYAALGKPVNAAPVTLTGEAWIAAMDRQTEQALEAIYR